MQSNAVSPVFSLARSAAPYRTRIATHPLFDRLVEPGAFAAWIEHEVYVAWGLLTRLQHLRTETFSRGWAWTLRSLPRDRRLTAELVLAEEARDDTTPASGSRFETLLHGLGGLHGLHGQGGMIDGTTYFLDALEQGARLAEALETARAPRAAARYLLALDHSAGASHWAGLGALLVERHEILSDEFAGIALRLSDQTPQRETLIDAWMPPTLTPIGAELLQNLLRFEGAEALAKAEAGIAAAFDARITLWDALVAALPTASHTGRAPTVAATLAPSVSGPLPVG